MNKLRVVLTDEEQPEHIKKRLLRAISVLPERTIPRAERRRLEADVHYNANGNYFTFNMRHKDFGIKVPSRATGVEYDNGILVFKFAGETYLFKSKNG